MGKLFVNSELVESNGYEAHIGDETDARIPWKITGNKIERDGSETRALARACIPEQPDLIDSLTFEFKKRSSLDLRINKLTKLLPSLLVNTMESEPCHDFSLSLSKVRRIFPSDNLSLLFFLHILSYITKCFNYAYGLFISVENIDFGRNFSGIIKRSLL